MLLRELWLGRRLYNIYNKVIESSICGTYKEGGERNRKEKSYGIIWVEKDNFLIFAASLSFEGKYLIGISRAETFEAFQSYHM